MINPLLRGLGMASMFVVVCAIATAQTKPGRDVNQPVDE